MKWILIFFFISLNLESKGQNEKFPPDSLPGLSKRKVTDTSILIRRKYNNNPPLVYLDSVPMVDIPFLDANTLENITIVNGYDSTYQRKWKMYMTSKKGSNLNLLSVSDIKTRYSLQTDKNQTLWMIDNSIIERLHYFRIDSSCLYKIEVQEYPDIDSLDKGKSGLTIIKMYSKKNRDSARVPEVKLRGSVASE